MFSQSQIGDDIDEEDQNDEFGFSVSLSSNGNIVAIGASGNDVLNKGHVRVYQHNLGSWTQIGSDIDGEGAFDESGHSISLSSDGSIVAIGAHSNGDNDNSSDQVRVYENLLGTWTQIGNDIDGQSINFQFGNSVSLSSNGTILAVGAINGGTTMPTGQVKIYRNQSSTWTQIGNSIDGEETLDTFGFNISLSSDGTTLLVGAPQNDGDSGLRRGHASVYNLDQLLSVESSLTQNNVVYPNPTKGIFNIILNPDEKIENVNVYDSLGKLLFKPELCIRTS